MAAYEQSYTFYICGCSGHIWNDCAMIVHYYVLVQQGRRSWGGLGGGGLQPPQYSDILYSYHIQIIISAPPIITTLIRPCSASGAIELTHYNSASRASWLTRHGRQEAWVTGWVRSSIWMPSGKNAWQLFDLWPFNKNWDEPWCLLVQSHGSEAFLPFLSILHTRRMFVIATASRSEHAKVKGQKS